MTNFPHTDYPDTCHFSSVSDGDATVTVLSDSETVDDGEICPDQAPGDEVSITIDGQTLGPVSVPGASPTADPQPDPSSSDKTGSP